MNVYHYSKDTEITSKFEYDNGDISFNMNWNGIVSCVTFGKDCTTVYIHTKRTTMSVSLDARPCMWEENAIVFNRAVVMAYINTMSKKQSKAKIAERVQVYDHTTLVTSIFTYNRHTKTGEYNYAR